MALVTVTEQFAPQPSGAPSRGWIQFQLANWEDDGVGTIYPAAPVKVQVTTGTLSVQLPPTDIGPVPQAYVVTGQINGVSFPTRYVQAPSSLAGTSATLSSLTEVAPSTAQVTFVEGPEGPAGQAGAPGAAGQAGQAGAAGPQGPPGPQLLTPAVTNGQVSLSLTLFQWAIDSAGHPYYLNGAPLPSGYTAALLGPDLRLYPIGAPAS